MRRLSLKNKRKTLETKSATTNSDLKEISDENGGSLESANVNEITGRASKLRRSRNKAEYEEFSDADSVDSTKDKLNEATAKVGREKRGRGSTSGVKTEENGDSLDSAAESSRGSKSRRSRNQNEVDNSIPNKRTKRDGGEETSRREVESILAVRTVKNRRRYKVHWKGLSAEEDSWVNENKLSCPEILQDFLRKQKEKKNLPKPIKVDEDSEEYEASTCLVGVGFLKIFVNL
ncbi:hypothetical protein J437_LFUL008052 [Ladona fulva]|uniref:Chromo domain-containing protein n=1 Tax=Ladona fulva TaxID=123851 RepID=A0A8K0KFB7_LADFU|nr:hypothetical protein J437_LFUL008052 [Ladona fulva]